MMLRGMGFGNETAIYLASGKIYQAKRHLAPLLEMFPLLYTKESLATQNELAPFVVNTFSPSIPLFVKRIRFEEYLATTNIFIVNIGLSPYSNYLDQKNETLGALYANINSINVFFFYFYYHLFSNGDHR